jgi:hypothetical protein
MVRKQKKSVVRSSIVEMLAKGENIIGKNVYVEMSMSGDREDTTFVPVRISGMKTDHDSLLILGVVKGSSNPISIYPSSIYDSLTAVRSELDRREIEKQSKDDMRTMKCGFGIRSRRKNVVDYLKNFSDDEMQTIVAECAVENETGILPVLNRMSSQELSDFATFLVTLRYKLTDAESKDLRYC